MKVETVTFKDKIYTEEEFIQYIIDNYTIDNFYYMNAEINKYITSINSIKIGDLITSYHKGFHEIIAFDCRLDMSYSGTKRLHIIVDYKSKFNFQGERKNGKVILNCDLSYIETTKDYVERETLRLKNIITKLENL